MKKSQNGFLVIADITGYTTFLKESELEHAQDSLRSLLDLLMEHTKSPLVISRLEGDAVISYSLEGSFLKGQTLVEMIEVTYVAFRRAIELMVLNTTCTCNACQNIPNLDLKFFVHYGTFMLEPLPSYTELVGSDVNLVHRLAKNSVKETTRIRAYTMYTQTAIDSLDIQELSVQMTRHVEAYEHIGEVVTYIEDMHAVWERERDKARTFVTEDEALFIAEMDFPFEMVLMWDYVTEPKFRAMLIAGSDPDRSVVKNRTNGRIGLGATYHCAHGDSASVFTVIDWQPMEEYTITFTYLGTYTMVTTQLIPRGDSTIVRVLPSKARGGSLFVRNLLNFVSGFVLNRMMRSSSQKGLQDLYSWIEKDIAEGKVHQSEHTVVQSDEIDKAVAQSLAVK